MDGNQPMTSTEAIQFLLQLKHELETQDNRCTGDPYFVVQERKPIYGVDPEYGGERVWVDSEGEADEEEAAKLEETFDETLEEPDGYTRTGVIRQWVTVQSFLTSKGATSYIETQSHRHSGELRVYGESAHRNVEVKSLRQAILALDLTALVYEVEFRKERAGD